MASYSQSELDIKAKATVLSIDRYLAHYNVIQDIGVAYNKVCASTKAQKQTTGARKITEGVKLRLTFEMLCYIAFLTSKIIPKYASKRGLIRKKTNYELASYFNNQVAKYLLKLCQSNGMTKLREIILLSPPPDAKIKFGEPLHPLKRLKEYSKHRTNKRGTEVQQLGMYLGKALDPYHYPTLQGLWKTQAKTFVKVAEEVMTGVFKPPVKLKK